MRFVSSGLSGLWSFVEKMGCPLRHNTALKYIRNNSKAHKKRTERHQDEPTRCESALSPRSRPWIPSLRSPQGRCNHPCVPTCTHRLRRMQLAQPLQACRESLFCPRLAFRLSAAHALRFWGANFSRRNEPRRPRHAHRRHQKTSNQEDQGSIRYMHEHPPSHLANLGTNCIQTYDFVRVYAIFTSNNQTTHRSLEDSPACFTSPSNESFFMSGIARSLPCCAPIFQAFLSVRNLSWSLG